MNIFKIKTAKDILEGFLKPKDDKEALSAIHEADFVMEDKLENLEFLFEYYYIKNLEIGKRSSRIYIDTENGVRSFIFKNYEIKNIIEKFKIKNSI